MAATEAAGGRGTRWWRIVPPWAVALAAYAAVLLIYRPVSPFEWDEILFMRAMAKYDVAAHAPHPPGYPAFVALAKPVYWLTGGVPTAGVEGDGAGQASARGSGPSSATAPGSRSENRVTVRGSAAGTATENSTGTPFGSNV